MSHVMRKAWWGYGGNAVQRETHRVLVWLYSELYLLRSITMEAGDVDDVIGAIFVIVLPLEM